MAAMISTAQVMQSMGWSYTLFYFFKDISEVYMRPRGAEENSGYAWSWGFALKLDKFLFKKIKRT